MAVILSETLKAKLERVQKREWWPVALLAEVLDRPKCFIYRRIENGNFSILDDGGKFMKVNSASVAQYFSERYQ